MQAAVTSHPARTRRPRRLGIEAHAEFVGTLVAELDAAVVRLRAAAQGLSTEPAGGHFDLVGPACLDRSAGDVLRLVRLLDTIDGPGDRHHLQPLTLPETLAQAAEGLGLDVAVRGVGGDGRFVGDGESVRLGLELVLLALTDGHRRLQVGIAGDRVVVLEGAFDLSDDRRVWQLRCGRRVLEGENCRVRLIGGRGAYRVEIRASQP